jgi:hypothetical protein
MPEESSTWPAGALRRATGDEHAAVTRLAVTILTYHRLGYQPARDPNPAEWLMIELRLLWRESTTRLLAREMETDWQDGLADLFGNDVHGYVMGWLLDRGPLPDLMGREGLTVADLRALGPVRAYWMGRRGDG